MKREDLKALGLEETAIDSIMALHGKGIESLKSNIATLQSEADTLKTQLAEAGTAIESFKAMKPDELKAAADEWKAKAEKAQTDAAAQLAQVKFDHALETALNGAKVKNVKAVTALLSKDALKYNEADGTIVGLNEQIDKIKSENDYLFADTKPAPQIVKGGNNQSVVGDAFDAAMRKGANLATPT